MNGFIKFALSVFGLYAVTMIAKDITKNNRNNKKQTKQHSSSRKYEVENYSSKNPQIIQNRTGTLTFYKVSGCPHCEEFLPIWKQFVQYAKTNHKNIKTEMVDCMEQPEKCQNIDRVPMIVFKTQDNKSIEFIEDRNFSNLVSFIKKVESSFTSLSF